MQSSNEAFSRVIIDSQLTAQGWSIHVQQTAATAKAQAAFDALLAQIFRA